jgi:hypothetical protein
MDDKETTRKTPEAIVVSTHPDVCKSPVAPVPYQIVGIFKDSSALASSVLATIQNVFVATSQIDRVTGDEGGTGKGIKSGTHADSGVCKPTGWSPTVRAEKQFVVRNGDPFTMNTGNTDGNAVYPDGAGPAGGIDEEGKPTQDPNPNIEREKKGFFEGIGKSGGDAVEDAKGLFNAAFDSGPAGDAARAALGESAKSTASMGMDGFLFLHGAPMDKVGAFNRIVEKGTDIVSAVKDRYVEAYEVGGFRYAMGVVTGDVVIGAAGTKGTTVGVRAAMRRVGNGIRVTKNLKINFGDDNGKIRKQMKKRGWTEDDVRNTIQNPTRTVPTRDVRSIPGGGNMDNSATAYFANDGSYVVRNDITGDIVQVSDKNDPNWIFTPF